MTQDINFDFNAFLRNELLSRRRAFLPVQNENTDASVAKEALAMIKEVKAEMMRLGFTMSTDLERHFMALPMMAFCANAQSLISSLENLKGDKHNFVTLHKDFPRQTGSNTYQVRRLIGIIETIFAGHHFAFESEQPDLVKLSCGCTFHPSLFNLSKFNACPVCQFQIAEMGNDIIGKKQGTVEFAKNVNIVEPIEIGMAQESDAFGIFSNLLLAATSISVSDIEFLTRMTEHYKDQVVQAIPSEIPQKEQLCLMQGLLIKHVPERAKVLSTQFKTATDAMRLAVYLSGGMVSLESTKSFKFKMTRSQRSLILFLLNTVKHPLEDMARRRTLFLSLGKYLHVGSEAKKYPNAANVFYVLRNEHKSIETFSRKKEALLSRVKGSKQQEKGFIPNAKIRAEKQFMATTTLGNAVPSDLFAKLAALGSKAPVKAPAVELAKANTSKAQDFGDLVALLVTRPGEFARWLDLLLREAGSLSQEQVDLVMQELTVNVLPKIKFSELLKINAQLANRSSESDFRAYIPKGNKAFLQFVEGDHRKTIDDCVITTLSASIYAEIHNRLKSKESLGDVYVSPELRNIVLPLAMRSASKATTVYPRGSRVPVAQECGVVRMYMYWKGAVDFDLSAVALNDSWESIASSSYCDWERQDWANFSGDVRRAPRGAAECIDIKIDAAKEMGIRYVVMFVNIFTEGSFEDYNSFVGVMEAKDELTGEAFEPSAARNRMDLVGDAQGSIPLILDLEKMEYIVTDLDMRMASGSNSYSQRSKLIQSARMIEQEIRVKPTVYELVLAHAVARAENISFVDEQPIDGIGEPKEFDHRFDVDFALKLDDVMANWLVD